jgi:hypothetical protein
MPAAQSRQQAISSRRLCAHRSSQGTSAAAKLVDVGIAFAGAEFGTSAPGSCSHCWAPRSPQTSTARWPNFFCSDHCEQEFVRAALAVLTVEDCARMHAQLESLLRGAEATALRAVAAEIRSQT